MTLRHLRIFICVCDEMGMTRAAEKLHMTQPSVSQAVAELEEHYDMALFERLGKSCFLRRRGMNCCITRVIWWILTGRPRRRCAALAAAAGCVSGLQ